MCNINLIISLKIYDEKNAFNLLLKKGKIYLFVILFRQAIHQGLCKYFTKDFAKPSADTAYRVLESCEKCKKLWNTQMPLIFKRVDCPHVPMLGGRVICFTYHLFYTRIVLLSRINWSIPVLVMFRYYAAPSTVNMYHSTYRFVVRWKEDGGNQRNCSRKYVKTAFDCNYVLRAIKLVCAQCLFKCCYTIKKQTQKLYSLYLYHTT